MSTLQRKEELLKILLKSSDIKIRGTWRVKGSKKGPKVGVVILLHGNEPCGLGAFEYFLKSPKIINKGEITFLVGNIYATYFNKTNPSRFVQMNMNRIPRGIRSSLPELKRFWAIHQKLISYDLILDLHSTSVSTQTMCIPNSACSKDLIDAIPTDIAVYNVYAIMKDLSLVESLLPKPAMVVECGEHSSVMAWENAKKVVISALEYLDVLNRDAFDLEVPQTKVEKKFVRVVNSLWAYKSGFKMAKRFSNLEIIKRNQILASHPDGDEIRSLQDGLILFPFGNDKCLSTNEEICFIAEYID